jgi:hypothetical protein
MTEKTGDVTMTVSDNEIRTVYIGDDSIPSVSFSVSEEKLCLGEGCSTVTLSIGKGFLPLTAWQRRKLHDMFDRMLSLAEEKRKDEILYGEEN